MSSTMTRTPTALLKSSGGSAGGSTGAGAGAMSNDADVDAGVAIVGATVVWALGSMIGVKLTAFGAGMVTVAVAAGGLITVLAAGAGVAMLIACRTVS